MIPRRVVMTGALLAALAGCSNPSDQTASSPRSSDSDLDAFLTDHDLAGMSGEEIVDHLDRVAVVNRATDFMASVRAGELVLADENREVSAPLDDAQFYLSVAPYVQQTHDCYFHSLTTCLGELTNTTMDLRITGTDGATLVDKTVTTFDNGFIGFWLPAGVSGTVEAHYEGRTGRSAFSSNADGATCMTTLQLKG